MPGVVLRVIFALKLVSANGQMLQRLAAQCGSSHVPWWALEFEL